MLPNERFYTILVSDTWYWLLKYHGPPFIGPPTLVGIGTLEFTLVRPSVRASVRKILNDYPLYFLKFCIELQCYMGEM